MDVELRQLQRNRAKVFAIAAGLFLIGSQGPDIGDFISHRIGHQGDRHGERITVELDRVDEAAARAADLAERAALMAERAADAAERASEQR